MSQEPTTNHSFGSASLTPADPVWAGSFGSWLLTLTVGQYGLDDGGTLAVARRDISDWEIPQFDRPNASGFVSAETTGHARLRLAYNQNTYVRPWRAAIIIEVLDGALAPGDQIALRLGDTRQGSPGMRVQTFPESRHVFKVLVDPFATGRYLPMPDPPSLTIISGPAESLQVVVPSFAGPGQPFGLLARVLDSFGNPSSNYRGRVYLEAEGVDGLPVTLDFEPQHGGLRRLEGLSATAPGVLRVAAHDKAGRAVESNPVLVSDTARPNLYWGDLHGQTGETIGTGTIEEYLRFGREAAALDFIGWQGNDFQINSTDWERVQQAIKDSHAPGRFITFLGYEWSGVTTAGGDHNFHFLADSMPLHRTSHWLVEDNADADTDRYPLPAALAEFTGGQELMAVPHVGGRRANLDFFDPRYMPVIEIHSHHGTFEWMAEDALRRGLRAGFIGGSDDHTCRPGLSYPTGNPSRGSGLASFDVKGGLAAVFAPELTRQAIWDALFQRHAYATSGERIILLVSAPDGLMHGDELRGPRPPVLQVAVHGTTPLHRVEVRRGLEVIYTWPNPAQTLGLPLSERRLAVVWSGTRTRERNKKANWEGQLTVVNGSIRAAQPFAFDRPDEGIVRVSNQTVTWRSTTSGDPDGVLLALEGEEATQLRFTAGPAAFAFSLGEVGESGLTVPAGGANLQVQVYWTPARAAPKDLAFTFQDPTPMPDKTNAYWIRVLQQDGALAWSSPLYYDLESG